MSTSRPFRMRRRSNIVEIDLLTRNTALRYFLDAIFADPSRVDILAVVMAKPDDLNEKGLLQDDEIALFVTKVIAAVKDCNGDMNMAREKVLEFRMQLW